MKKRPGLIFLIVIPVLLMPYCSRHPLLNPLDHEYSGDPVALGDVIYVSPSGSDDNSGFSPDSPKKDIREAALVAFDLGVPEIRAAEGTYTITEGIWMRPGVSVIGGYNQDFSVRDFESFISVLESKTPSGRFIQVSIDDEGIANDVVFEGFTLQIQFSGSSQNWCSSIAIGQGSSPVIRHNKIVPDNNIEFIGAGGESTNAIVENNSVYVKTTGEASAIGIYINDCGSGSDIVLANNQVAVYSEQRYAIGIDLNLVRGLTLKNNIVAAQSMTSYGCYAIQIKDTVGKILNNTCTAFNGASSLLVGIYINDLPVDTDLDIINNIISLGRYTNSYGLQSRSPGTQNFDYNLLFNCQADIYQEDGGVVIGGANQHETTNIFALVFSSAFDFDLSDGDSADYHLSDAGDLYAVDLGTNTNKSLYGNVDEDFEGDSRPIRKRLRPGG